MSSPLNSPSLCLWGQAVEDIFSNAIVFQKVIEILTFRALTAKLLRFVEQNTFHEALRIIHSYMYIDSRKHFDDILAINMIWFSREPDKVRHKRSVEAFDECLSLPENKERFDEDEDWIECTGRDHYESSEDDEDNEPTNGTEGQGKGSPHDECEKEETGADLTPQWFKDLIHSEVSVHDRNLRNSNSF